MNIICTPNIYVILPVFFFADLSVAYFFSYPYLQLLWSLFSVALFATNSLPTLCSLLGFLYLEYFSYISCAQESVNVIAYATLWIVPLLPFLNYRVDLFSYLFFFCSLVIAHFLQNPSWIITPSEISCTIIQIFANLLLIRILLKYKN